ncbi:hypothetical protein BpHYR1_012526 [Brachionus plicatilis]|uniref:RNA-directed DNA polymerase from mobile element jockey-like n=1 Tax=Brachionus plicatilis TaxID=10195 RepID=A0A3M7SCJ6_BRAPC|nr:hypothetical protein BpHYR1_012526 [Brachionus plicatilis]
MFLSLKSIDLIQIEISGLSFTPMAVIQRHLCQYHWKLFNKTIPYSKTNKFLGPYFDESLCFDKQIKEALIGSILEYNFPCLNSFSESGLQNKIDHRLSNLLENSLRNALDYPVPLTNTLVSETLCSRRLNRRAQVLM